MKHTPGPWIYHSGMVWKPAPGERIGPFDEGDIPIARMDRETPHTAPWERDANARLIASVPELVEALQRIASCEVRSEGDVVSTARAALAKAGL